ncbi:MAG: PAS domain S-box protein [Deltaproteobacteria bacterium]
MTTPQRDADQLSSINWRAIAEEASDGLFVTDVCFTIVWVNQRSCDLLHRPARELVGHRIPEFFWDPDETDEHPLRREELVAGRSTITLRAFRTGDGERRVLEVSAKGIGDGLIVGIARDATERLATLQRLERSEASFRALAEQSPDSILVHANGAVLYVNRAGARLLGFDSPQTAVGASALDLVHPDDREAVVGRVIALNSGGEAVPFSDERMIRRDGSSILVSIGAVRVVFEGTPAIAAILRDVTEQRAFDAQYAQAEKMASIGLLAAGVAHEVNNPLAYTMLRIEAIASLSKRLDAGLADIREVLSGRDDAEAQAVLRACDQQAALLEQLGDHVATAIEGSERVRSIINDLRVFSRLDRDDRSVVEVTGPLRRALSIAGHALDRRAKVVQDIAETPPVLASPGRLTQVFLNLLLNASEAIPEGGADTNEVRVRARLVDGAVHVSISDTGCGVAPADLHRLFEPFFTTRPSGVSTGLGLAICHGIVTSLGGTITVESKIGVGTTFTVALPQAPGGD